MQLNAGNSYSKFPVPEWMPMKLIGVASGYATNEWIREQNQAFIIKEARYTAKIQREQDFPVNVD